MKGPDAKIPMLDLAAQHAELEEELLDGISAVLSSGRFILGEPVESFENDLARLCSAPHAISCHSGTDALWLSLKALDIGPGDAVLCPAYSFFATAATIARVGATPIFCDIDAATLNLDGEDALGRALRHPSVRAVIPVDLFGRVCDLGPLEAHCRNTGIPIIQDAAQSIGALDDRGQRVGTRSDLTCFSFYPTKNLGALGDAGAVVTANASLRDRIKVLRVHGETKPGVYTDLGINSRLDALQAIVLSIKLRHLDRWIRERQALARAYDEIFAAQGATTTDADPSGTALPLQTPVPECDPAEHTYHRYVVRVPAEKRANLIAALAQEGIASEIYYPRGLHEQPALASFKPRESLVQSERASRETLALPLYPEMGTGGVERVADAVVRGLRRG